MAEGILIIALSFIPALIALPASFTAYALGCLPLYRLAQLHGHQRKYLAFIPVANAYMTGRIADDAGLCNDKRTSFRKILLILEAVMLAVVFGFVIIYVLFMISSFVSIPGAVPYSSNPFNFMPGSVYTSSAATGVLSGFALLLLIISSLVMSLVSVGYSVVYYIVLYKIYNHYLPRHSAIFLVLSIFLSPIYLFFAFAYMPEVKKQSAAMRRVLRQHDVIPPGQEPECECCGH